ncbi:hypothetical protein HU200_041892 [Digitaria exilis]|uniref:Uncharacterized protein n=1 Tax=Digitaria exilis TaxID=1010633 RepID=A0A835EHI8_9POAL|nr:hypothetical protein HU200_041892 [Digitaria exilis]CAB3495265.1 unnamed protein product [Digitaria exilis]
MMSNEVVCVLDVLNARDTARKVYELLLARPTGLEVAKNVICLLLWLETIMGIEVLSNIAAMAPGDILLTQIVAEASAVYDYIFHGSYSMQAPLELEGIPAIMNLCNGGRLVDIRFFKFHKDLVARGVAVIRDNIGSLIFNENLHVMLRRFNDDANSSLIPAPLPAPELMAPFVALSRTPPEDSRMAFLAFPECHCHRPNSEDIVNHFEETLRFGPCIERVETEQPPAGQAPKHGIIVFLSPELRDEAMFDETAIFFRVDDHDTWVQLYMPLL